MKDYFNFYDNYSQEMDEQIPSIFDKNKKKNIYLEYTDYDEENINTQQLTNLFQKTQTIHQQKEQKILSLSNEQKENKTNRKNAYTQTESKEIEQDKEIVSKTIQEITISSLSLRREKKSKNCSLLGRKKKNFFKEGIYHGKCSKDNILRKIKRYIINNSRIWINYELPKESQLIKVDKSIFLNYSKEFNRRLMSIKLRDFFCNKSSKKYSTKDKFYNKKEVIEKIYKDKNNKFAITKLNLTYKQYFDIFLTRELSDEIKEQVLDNLEIRNFDEEIQKTYLMKFLYKFKFMSDFIDSNRTKGKSLNNEEEKKYINELYYYCNYENWNIKKKN